MEVPSSFAVFGSKADRRRPFPSRSLSLSLFLSLSLSLLFFLPNATPPVPRNAFCVIASIPATASNRCQNDREIVPKCRTDYFERHRPSVYVLRFCTYFSAAFFCGERSQKIFFPSTQKQRPVTCLSAMPQPRKFQQKSTSTELFKKPLFPNQEKGPFYIRKPFFRHLFSGERTDTTEKHAVQHSKCSGGGSFPFPPDHATVSDTGKKITQKGERGSGGIIIRSVVGGNKGGNKNVGQLCVHGG